MGMNATELVERIDTGRPPTILDVRSRWEFSRGRVPGARHIPFWWLHRLWPLDVSRDEPLVVYCMYGPRAWMAGTVLTWAGFRHIRYLRGHMAGWRRDGHREER